MSKKVINVQLLDARHTDNQTLVREAKWLESLESKGSSPEEISQKAKDFLNFEGESSVIADSDDKIVEYNHTRRSLIDLNKIVNRLVDYDIVSEEELGQLKNIEVKLADKVKNIYNLSDEDLYKEEI
jgi:hypothetical protein